MSGAHRLLFLDSRHIDAGTAEWHTTEGARHGVGAPPGSALEMHVGASTSPRGVRLHACPATTTEPVGPWQGWGRVTRDGGVFRTWRMLVDGNHLQGSASPCQTPHPRAVEIVALESTDGLDWREVSRSPIQVPGQSRFDGQTFFVDHHAPSSERYKLIYNARPPDQTAERLYQQYLLLQARHQDPRILHSGVRSCLYAATSADGVEWQSLPEPLMLHAGDTDNTVSYHDELGRYVLYTRWFRHGRRWVGRAESQDFLRWGPIEPVLWPDLDAPLDHDIYLNAYSRYPGLPQYHLMFAMHYYRSTERSDVHLYSSDDGIAWQRVPGSPVLTPGELGTWDSEFIAGGKDLLELAPGRVGIPYIATSYPHKYPRWPEVFAAWKTGWAWWPTDRLCSVRADEDGRFRTLPLEHRGPRVVLNYRTRRAGSVRIGVVGVEGRTTERCIPLHGDETDRVVTWHGGSTITGSKGTPVILDVELRAAELFSIRLE